MGACGPPALPGAICPSRRPVCMLQASWRRGWARLRGFQALPPAARRLRQPPAAARRSASVPRLLKCMAAWWRAQAAQECVSMRSARFGQHAGACSSRGGLREPGGASRPAQGARLPSIAADCCDLVPFWASPMPHSRGNGAASACHSRGMQASMQGSAECPLCARVPVHAALAAATTACRTPHAPAACCQSPLPALILPCLCLHASRGAGASHVLSDKEGRGGRGGHLLSSPREERKLRAGGPPNSQQNARCWEGRRGVCKRCRAAGGGERAGSRAGEGRPPRQGAALHLRPGI